TGAFPDRIESFQFWRLACGLVAENAYRGAAARLRADQRRLRYEPAAPLMVHNRKAVPQRGDDQGRHQFADASRDVAARITIVRNIAWLAILQKIADTLDRAEIIASAHLEST